jgi:hypothetical protein
MSSDHLLILKSFQFRAVGDKKMIHDEHPFNDISTWLHISSTESSHIATITRKDDVEDFNDDDIGMEMNKQVLLEDLSLIKFRLNYN